MKSRSRIILACCLAILGMGVLFWQHGYEETWRLWGIPTMMPHFADLRAITHGAEPHAMGVDLMASNPGDPWKRPLLYPRIWHGLYYLGINARHSTLLGVISILSFLAGICMVLPHAHWRTIAWVMAAILSPAVLLGIERANTDLLIFFLLAVSVVAVGRWPALSAAAVLLSMALKLFPIYGAAVLFRLSRRRFWGYVLAIAAGTLLYAYLTFADISRITGSFERILWASYGFNVFWMRTMHYSVVLGFYARILTYGAALVVFAWAFSSWLRKDSTPEPADEPLALDAFRSGAAIYLGTFLSGHYLDYKLMFLILAIPQLSAWTRSPVRRISACAYLALVSMLVSQWELAIGGITAHLLHGKLIGVFMDEMADWAVFASLLYLFFASMPDWVKAYGRNIHALARRPAG